jgi:hypothetical protein
MPDDKMADLAKTLGSLKVNEFPNATAARAASLLFHALTRPELYECVKLSPFRTVVSACPPAKETEC